MGVVDHPSDEVLFQVRIPRVILALSIGFGLAVSGVVLQAVFSNPLCEPYTLGVSSGAAFGAVASGTLFSVHFLGLNLGAFLGSLLFTVILYLISRDKNRNTITLLLCGIILGFFGSSLLALWMAVSDQNGIQGVVSWLFGDLSRGTLLSSVFTLLLIALMVFLLWSRWRDLDILMTGDDSARILGVSLHQTRTYFILVVSLLISVCVSAGGMIGFVGLIIPHFSRGYVGSLHKNLIPFSGVLGAVFLVASDLFSRTIFAPVEIPVGVVTALVGAPIFAWLAFRGQSERFV